ncbi:hypothetical protein ACFLQN_03345 [Candidatus Aenigmatarchaeota archaeon]
MSQRDNQPYRATAIDSPGKLAIPAELTPGKIYTLRTPMGLDRTQLVIARNDKGVDGVYNRGWFTPVEETSKAV